jgi:predicted Rdx family selenoprotein
LAAELKQEFGVDARLIKGQGGIFDVEVDGRMVFSKHKEGARFPEDGEVAGRIRQLKPAKRA